jgi:hypothetical protein
MLPRAGPETPQQRYLRVHVYRWTEAGTDLAGSKAAPLSARPGDTRVADIAPNARPWMAHAAMVRTRKARYLKDERVWDA